MMKLVGPLLARAAAIALPLLALAACATDNGANVFGDQFTPPGKKLDAGNDVVPVPGSVDDAGADAPSDAPSDAPPSTCTSGTIAVLAGGDSALSGSVQVNGGAWTGGAITATNAASKSLPALVPFGTGFAGMVRDASDALLPVSVTTTFAAGTAIPTVTTKDAPALAVVGTTAHLVYLDKTNLFFHGTNTGAGWDAATDPVKVANVQSYGPSAPALAAAGADAVFAQVGDNGGVYAQAFSSGSWGTSSEIAVANKAYKPAALAMASLSGAKDLALVYVDSSTRQIQWSLRDAAAKTWSAPTVTSTLALSDEPMSLARVGTSTLLLAFRGQDLKGYSSTGTISGNSITWSAPAPIVAGGALVDSAPAVAKGVCGDDAIAVFAPTSMGGVVKATRLRGTAWSDPESVTGASGPRVAVATR